MKCIITEKPSVAREIAAIIGATNKEDGFYYGNGYTVTYALGHLVNLAMPEDYGFTGYNREDLPIIPNPFILKPRQTKDGKTYKPDAAALRQLKVIDRLFKKCDSIIVCTDAGREGECIFRYIYSYLSCNKPFERLWISSLTEKAIKSGFQNLKPGSDYDNLYFAAKARSEADWLIGLNASRALSITAGRGIFSLGRVQTPTLAMICKRFLENKNFVPVPFWQFRVKTEKAGVAFAATGREKYGSKETADSIFTLLQQQKTLSVQSVEKKEFNQLPPLLYDLTTLQKEANTKHGFSADNTLNIAQKLYEMKLITYPRTGSRYIPADVFEEIPKLLKTLENHFRFGNYVHTMPPIVPIVPNVPNVLTVPTFPTVNNQKVTDHHALLITENQPAKLPADEQLIYDMIAGRILESFSPKCIKYITTVTLTCEDIVFEAKGTVVKQAGWRTVFNEKEETEDENALPQIEQSETLPILLSEMLEKQTKPKPLHTEASLLAAMEHAGKEIENEAERESIKDSGIGTPATRAAIIETLFTRDYIRRDKKSIVPTEKGMTVYDTVKDKRIADVALTGEWENALSQVESGEMLPETFRRVIEIYTRQITAELLDTMLSVSGDNACICPKCKAAGVLIASKVAKCRDPNCGLIIFRTISEKQLSDSQITDLLTNGKTPLIRVC